MITVGILTISDRGYRGEREDLSGKEIETLIKEINGRIEAYEVIPDEKEIIVKKLIDFSENKQLDLILTTGGTGVSPRDVTPEATWEVIEKEVPGIAEAMRRESIKKTPHGMISRAVSGIRKNSLVINLPGSPRAVRENLSVVLSALSHAVEKIKGDPSECAGG
jgi:molybdenum cofactor synthesis domain-containing protein